MIYNLPERVKQYELEALFGPVPGTVAVALMNSKYGGIARDGETVAAGYLLMTSIQTAQGLMRSSEWRHNSYCRDKKMELQFAHDGLESSMIPKVFPHGKYWICRACHVDNAPKREMCVSCGSLRSIGCDFVDPTVPTRTIRIMNIDRSVSENDVEDVIRRICPVHTVKFSRDGVSGHHKGTAYCECFTVEDAIKISRHMKDRVFGDNGQLCMVEYGVERFSIDDKAVVDEQPTWEPAEFQANQVYHAPTRDNEHEDHRFIYDSGSGYYWDTKDQVWGTKDPVTGSFVPYTEPTLDRAASSPTQKSSKVECTLDEKKSKTVQGVIHAGTWANKKKKTKHE